LGWQIPPGQWRLVTHSTHTECWVSQKRPSGHCPSAVHEGEHASDGPQVGADEGQSEFWRHPTQLCVTSSQNPEPQCEFCKQS